MGKSTKMTFRKACLVGIIVGVILLTAIAYFNGYPILPLEASQGYQRTSYEWKWDRVTDDTYQLDRHIIDTPLHIITDRMKVDGGWIYRSYAYTVDTNDFSTHQVFVPDLISKEEL